MLDAECREKRSISGLQPPRLDYAARMTDVQVKQDTGGRLYQSGAQQTGWSRPARTRGTSASPSRLFSQSTTLRSTVVHGGHRLEQPRRAFRHFDPTRGRNDLAEKSRFSASHIVPRTADPLTRLTRAACATTGRKAILILRAMYRARSRKIRAYSDIGDNNNV